MKAKKKIVFIVGTSFSGSTLLGASLVGDQKISFLSEVDRFALFNRHEPNYMLHSCTVCEMSGDQENCPVFGTKRTEAISQHTTILNKYIELISPLNCNTIDSSKNVDWVNHLFDNKINEFFDICVLVSVRNPIAYSYSESGAISSKYWEGVIAWRETYHHVLRSLIHRRIPFIICPYEMLFIQDAVENINKGLSVLTNHEIHIDLSQGAIEHALGGNLSAYIAHQPGIDRSWRNAKCFDEGDSWKIDENPMKKGIITESTRWLDMNKTDAYSLLDIPGVLDLAGLFGYTNEFLASYIERMIASAP